MKNTCNWKPSSIFPNYYLVSDNGEVNKDGDFVHEIKGEKYLLRVRKITPIECWRIMGFKESDYHKAEKVNSKTQLAKQAGNSIVVSVLMGIFSQLNIVGVPKWNDLTDDEIYKLIDIDRH